MSQVKVNSIVDASGGSNAVLYGVASPPNSMGFRNRLINGAMTISQRNGTTATAWANSYDLDRWSMSTVSDAAGTVAQINSGGPAGFPSFRRISVTTADASLSSTQYQWGAVQNIEGYNIADLAWGTANAVPVTLQLAVRSSKTGTFSLAIGVGSPAQYIFQNVTINAANTWETKTVTFLGNTTTAPVSTTNGVGITVYVVTAAGTAYQGTPNAWTSSVHLASSSNSNFLDTNGTTFDITGVQLEAGTNASPFERRDYGRELMMCQRYCEAIAATGSGSDKDIGIGGGNGNAGNFQAFVAWKVQKRAAPTLTLAAASNFYVHVPGAFRVTCTSVSPVDPTEFGSHFSGVSSSGSFNAGQMCFLAAIPNTPVIIVSAEL